MNNIEQAQQRVLQIHGFERELAVLQSDKVLTLNGEQLNAVASYHSSILNQLKSALDVDVSETGKHLSLGMQIVSFIGALAFAASVFFLFYQYWGYFSSVMQVSFLMGASTVGLLATKLVQRVDRSGYYVKLVALVAFSCFVLNILMFGKIFNLPPSPNAFLIYSIYALLLAYALNVRLLLGVGLISLIVFCGAKFGTFWGLYWVSAGEYPELGLPVAAAIFSVPSFLSQDKWSGFKKIYHLVSSCSFFICLLILSNWGGGSLLPWDSNIIEGIYQTLGFVMSGLLIYYGLKSHQSHLMFAGNTFFTMFIYTKFFDWWLEWLPKSVFFFLVGLTALLMILIFQRVRNASSRGLKDE